VSETLARQVWPAEDPIGRRLKVGLPDTSEPWLEIVGIVGDVLHSGLSTSRTPELYVPYAQTPGSAVTLVVRASTGFAGLSAALKAEIARLDPLLPVADVQSMEDVVSRSVASPRFRALLLSIFAGIAVLLASVGVYGVMACSVAQRTQEIGIRLALGAGRRDVFRLLIGQGMRLTAAGVVIGLAGAAVLTRLLQRQLFAVRATDPATLAAGTLLLGLVALLACCIPARRATRVDPLTALRDE
jgi:putative ABC transport system permease protein